jgi:uncharacterized membrane protein YgdD (TMEM256/DUF423 family)
MIKSIAAALIAMGIGMGAFGAHGLRPLLEERPMEVYETAVFYLITQAIGLLWLSNFKIAGPLLISGILLFSGSLFLLSTASLHGLPVQWLGPITPVGGLLMMAAWLQAAFEFSKTKKSQNHL